jgi:enamine deaminase RidA (YjgF/YER057c/UK114 family)
MSAETRLKELGISLPPPPTPGGNYVSAKLLGNLLFLSGVISTDEQGVIAGQINRNRTIDEGYRAARQCVLTQLAVLRQTLGSLDRIRQIISVNGYVNAVADFPDSAKVINGASDLLIEVFGEAGRHVRAAIGVVTLPRCALAEIQMSVEISEGIKEI